MMRILLLFFMVAIGITFLFFTLDWLLGHRLLIPLARALRFKIDDVEKTEKKVSEILGDDYDKKKSKSSRRKN